MRKKTTEYFKLIKESIKRTPYIFAVIGILGLTQAFYRYIPEAFILNFILLFAIFFLLSETVSGLKKTQKIIIYFLLPFLIIGNHCLYLFTYREYIAELSVSLVIFFCCSGFILYFYVKENFLNEFKSRIIHILLSLLFFASSYGLIYTTAYFIDHIFNLKLEYYDSILYRFANSFSTIIGSVILSSYKKKNEYRNSHFFTLMFKKILPVLLIPVLSLAVIYFSKLIIWESYDFGFDNELYYIGVIIFFIILAMMQLCEDNKKLSKIIILTAAVLPLLFIAVFLKYRHNSIEYWRAPCFTSETAYIIHEVMLNILISAYCFYLFFKKKKIDNMLIHLAFLVVIILYLPAFGYHNFSRYKNFYAIQIVKDKNKYEEFKTAYKYYKQRYENRFTEEEYSETFFVYPKCSYRENTNSEIILDVENFKFAFLGMYLDLSSEEKKVVSRYGYTFELDDTGKYLNVTSDGGSSYKFDIYSALKPYEKKEAPETIFEEKEFKIQIIKYGFTERRSNYLNNYLTCDVFFKK
ncbi:hypothetical protein [Treponema pedis]|uniref:hypothetical protein n=1 Tax=Treponema pedis TaxID=409322 RepID=UPI00198015AC|nr:hypothetical protein [Treponema pedis]